MRQVEREICGIKYLLREDGKVFSVSTGKEISQRLNEDGYLVFTAGRKGNRQSVRTHRVIALEFVPNPNNFSDVDHLDCNRANASADNLEWVSHRENVIRSHKRGRHDTTGENNGRAKLTTEQVMIIRVLYDYKGMKIAEIAKILGRGHSTILNIVHRNTWKHI